MSMNVQTAERRKRRRKVDEEVAGAINSQSRESMNSKNETDSPPSEERERS